MARVTTIINQKGGVAKTTTASALANGLSIKGYKCLAIDLDPQANLTFAMGADGQQTGIYEVLCGEVHPLMAIQQTEQCDIITGSLNLANSDKDFPSIGIHLLLQEAIKPLREQYQYIIIDTPPALGTLTINALAASNDVVIPVGADIFSLQGFVDICQTIRTVQQYYNPSLTIDGLLITRFTGWMVLSRDLRDVIVEKAIEAGTRAYKTVIREGIAAKEAQAFQESIYGYAKRSNPSKDYMAFIKEYTAGEEPNE